MTRRQWIFVASLIVFYVGNLITLVVAANHGWLDAMVRWYVVPLGLVAIALGLGLIFVLLRKPPFNLFQRAAHHG